MGQVYDLEYREYVCRMVTEEGRTVTSLAKELNISRSTLHRWLEEYKAEAGWVEKYTQQKEEQEPTVYKTPSDYEKELAEERKLRKQVERENKILKKAMHVFTENHE